MNKKLILSLLLNLLLLIGVGLALREKGGVPWLMRKIHSSHSDKLQDTKQSVYDALPVGPNDTVFIGDSILAYGEWAELMNDPHCKNRAIAGSTTADVLARLPRLISGHPKQIILLAGINDIQKQIPAWVTLGNIRRIVSMIKAESPQTTLTVLPVMPVNEAKYAQWIVPDHAGVHMPAKDECLAINEGISPAIDSVFLLQDGANTNDGLHLNGRGLVELAKILGQR